MKNKLFFLFILLGGNLYAQDSISISRAIYHAKHSIESADQYNGKNTLHFNQDRCLYIHDNFPVVSSDIDQGSYTKRITGDPEKASVFINIKEQFQYSKTDGFLGLCILKEPLETIRWEVINTEQKMIKGYSCVKAKGVFGGRDYEVWFSPQIPTRFGPYKLWGLPGLILEAKSLDGKVSWEFVGFEAVTTQPNALRPPSYGKMFTWDEFVKAKLNYRLQKEIKYNYAIRLYDGSPDAGIEKGKFNIYEKYAEDYEKMKME